jgi:hypothetical protein
MKYPPRRCRVKDCNDDWGYGCIGDSPWDCGLIRWCDNVGGSWRWRRLLFSIAMCTDVNCLIFLLCTLIAVSIVVFFFVAIVVVVIIASIFVSDVVYIGTIIIAIVMAVGVVVGVRSPVVV